MFFLLHAIIIVTELSISYKAVKSKVVVLAFIFTAILFKVL